MRLAQTMANLWHELADAEMEGGCEPPRSPHLQMVLNAHYSCKAFHPGMSELRSRVLSPEERNKDTDLICH